MNWRVNIWQISPWGAWLYLCSLLTLGHISPLCLHNLTILSQTGANAKRSLESCSDFQCIRLYAFYPNWCSRNPASIAPLFYDVLETHKTSFYQSSVLLTRLGFCLSELEVLAVASQQAGGLLAENSVSVPGWSQVYCLWVLWVLVSLCWSVLEHDAGAWL